jgi:4-amino-4-deoxy-L-arabinose transferase-like glycosyltransferase
MIVGLSGLTTVPPLDRDESRFIQATTQMIETGDYLRIKFQDRERNKKPVGIYWLQAASVQTLADVADRPLWAYRLPSLLGAMLATIFTYLAGTVLFGRQAALLGALLLAAAPVVAGEASIAKTDAVLLATVCGMQAALARLFFTEGAPSRRAAIAFWLAMGIGILVKGPITPMIGLFTVVGFYAWSRRSGAGLNLRATLRPLMGLAILMALVLPWAIAIGIVTEGRFFTEAVGTDMLGKITTGQERHDGPIGYHTLAFWAMFWPAGLFVPPLVQYLLPRWSSPALVFCLAWLVPTFIVFELTSTKLPHYPMVVYPALALLIGGMLTDKGLIGYRVARVVGAALYTTVGIAASVGIVYLASIYSSAGIVIWHYLGAGLVLGATLLAAYFAIVARGQRALVAASLASGLFAWGAFEGVLPTLDRLDVTPRLARMLNDNEAHPLRDDTGPVALVGYHEPSAVFTLGTDTRLLQPDEAAVWIIAGAGRAVVVEERDVEAFLAALPAGYTARPVASIEGFNYSNNKSVKLTLYRLG